MELHPDGARAMTATPSAASGAMRAARLERSHERRIDATVDFVLWRLLLPRTEILDCDIFSLGDDQTNSEDKKDKRGVCAEIIRICKKPFTRSCHSKNDNTSSHDHHDHNLQIITVEFLDLLIGRACSQKFKLELASSFGLKPKESTN
jgi:hypothetical protein